MNSLEGKEQAMNESIRSNSNYPPMTQSQWENAPFNQSDPPEQEFEVCVSQTLSKTVSVLTCNYISGASGVDYEPDDEGGYYASGWHDPDDTSATNWQEVYHDNDYHTPLQLLAIFKKFLEDELNNTHTISHSPSYLKRLSNECDGWTEDETDFCDE